MRETQLLSNLVWERIIKLRKSSCIGCICGYNFNRLHDICLTDAYNDFFYFYALQTLYLENLINNQEKQILENICKNINQYMKRRFATYLIYAKNVIK
jgi:hypothetical protein